MSARKTRERIRCLKIHLNVWICLQPSISIQISIYFCCRIQSVDEQVKRETIKFLKDSMNETMELFPKKKHLFTKFINETESSG